MKLSLRVVLLISVIGIQLLTVAGILLSSYLTTQDALLSHARELMRDLSTQAINRSEHFLEPARVTANLTHRLANSNILTVKNLAAMERLFFEQLRLFPWFSGVYYGGTDGTFVYVKREGEDAKTNAAFVSKLVQLRDGTRHVDFVQRSKSFEEISRRSDPKDTFDPRTRPWFKLALNKESPQWTEPYIFFTSKTPGISATIPAYEPGKAEMLGAIGVDIEIGQLSSFLGGLEIGKNGSAFILNRNGDVIAHPQPNLIRRPADNANNDPRFKKINDLDDPIARAAFSALNVPADRIVINAPEVRRFIYEDKWYLAVFTPFFSENWPWTMAIYVPEDDYLGDLKKQTRLNLYLGLAFAVLGCLLSFVIWQTIARPMRQLSEDAAAIQEGDLTIAPKTSSFYREVSNTADAFRKMVDGLRAHQQETLRLRRLQSRLMENIRKSTVGHFASTVSHELNNPLAALSTNLQIISRLSKRSNAIQEPKMLTAIEGAQAQAQRAGDIIRGLRELVESGESARSEEEINQVVREAVELANPDENIDVADISYNFADDLPLALMNRVQIQQVILNLLRNAADATSDVSVPTIRISTSMPNSAVVEIAVEDNGPGLSTEMSGQLFRPIVSAKPAGMGVGLSICRTIVEAHGGMMSQTPLEDSGARFAFTIPVVAKKETDA